MAFKNLNLIEPILKALALEGYHTPTPIQKQAIPLVLSGKDLLGCAQTGTGKTAAFSIPMIQLLHEQKKHRFGIKALILTPTRELAIQIDESLAAYSRFTSLRHTVIFGGVSQNQQTIALKKGVDILVATPGRLLDLINQRFIDLKQLQFFVLDEADRMLDMGFIHDVKKVISLLPSKRQTLFFSATMPPEIQKLADTLLTNPSKVEVTPPSSTVDKIDQVLYYTSKGDKIKLLKHLLSAMDIESALVFTRTKHGADRVVKFLQRDDIDAAAIHGNKSQNARQNALKGFKSGSIKVLVATDIAARGIDIDELAHVFNYDLPNIPETYVHRIGRTGRAGNSGVAISICDEEQRKELKDIEKLIGKTIPVEEDHPFPFSGNITPAIEIKKGNSQKGKRPSNNNFKRRPKRKPSA
ncbi:DEAD/DEAH box helicase [Belliella kenyensis]|uniref:DEAD/DEAH box helicase n=1 Tax=Belliella kenyensis TaxID=1472724 RepID=A0ABV8EQ15_9BACT|nr:DEAD/DEAH box helicase [Belliella kenyensis]MCH7402181.1 DEAD/DEAH box helicase [Belliella kenyensis]MDN3601696.1 DEAD/DEAH box helicase [Belliella kenyensis]